MYKDVIRKTKNEVLRGNVFMVDLGSKESTGSEQAGFRPAVILQNNIGNKYSPTIIVALVTSRCKHNIPTHVSVDLAKPSTIMCEQIITIDKRRLKDFIGTLKPDKMKQVEKALAISLGLASEYNK